MNRLQRDVNSSLDREASAPSHQTGRGLPVSPLGWVATALGAALLAYLIGHSLMSGGEEAGHGAVRYPMPPLGMCAPFVAMLLAIAILPLVSATVRWWESNLNRLCVALALGACTLAYYYLATGSQRVLSVLEHAVVAEYVPFIVLLFSLYVISGGISLRGDLPAHPGTNTAFLAVGAVLASFIGTTGASMLLIRPLLQTNSERQHVSHTVIFFIFLVSNIGGCLLPIGDPPLFLGYLRGVPFLWTFRLVVPWAVTCAILLAVYYVWDTLAYRRETPRDIRKDERERIPLSLRGTVNLLWLLGIVLCVALVDPGKELPALGFKPFPFMRELLMLILVGLSLKTTPSSVRAENRFNYHAILEVAALFIGIFVCMQVPIEILHERGPSLGLTRPWQFFWATGALSSFLDNAPTYVVFFSTADSLTHAPGPGIINLVGGGYIAERLLVGISLGAVFMGANTYIGNGPNFMVKSIAEQSGVKMPSFFGYMLYSTVILVPLFVLVTILFIR